jgi:hypothetical protein
MTEINAKTSLGAVLSGILLLGGCATTYTAPTDPAKMNAIELNAADRWFCYRTDYDGENVYAYPRKSSVTRIDNPYIDAWACHEWIGGELQIFRGDIAGEQIPEADRMGDGLIGANWKEQDGQFITTKIISGGAVAKTGTLKEGDRILAVASNSGDEPVPAAGLTLRQLIWHVRGEPGTEVDLVILPKGGYQTRKVTITREAIDGGQVAKLEAESQARERQNAENAVASLVINGNSGRYMSPYTSDGVTAEWVNKAINADIGATAGSGVGAAAGAYAANKALESIPFASVFGGMLGSAAGESIGRETAIEASGGWDFIRSTSDQSFSSLSDMAEYLRTVYGNEPTYADVVAATAQVYPEFADY